MTDYSPWDCKELDTNEQLMHIHTHTHTQSLTTTKILLASISIA